ncbi:CaiB/BaiF CoA transferase family protein [Pseudonocardia sp. HH130630-07]|uniref:CaiB/BaiF CoA transferase family protein n=1 Tax=Pseudonocardia sp. HH130630-07 TaxID=1690815 RepID=UPI000814D327|nr:CoA transferase [Pseudonocardia sp. HH130630-07]ANY09265.1 carnitine dehydratase [Pseudonocardia sp. HH130630-07]
MDHSPLDDAPTGGPLDGVLVADFSRVLAGPYATMMLGDLGATVVKVEGPGGDDTRTWKPPVRTDPEHGNIATYYLSINRNKRSVVLDLRDPADLAAAHRLAERADVVVENMKPGGMARFGLDHAAVAERNPSVVYCSISGFGDRGGAHLPGYDLLVQAVSGLMSVTGAADGPPYRAGVAVFDVLTGLHAALAVTAALQHRERTGEGQLLRTNLLAVAMSTLVNQTEAYVAAGAVPHRMGNEHPSVFPYQPMPTGDGELIVIAANDAQFRKLATVLGDPAMAEDPRFTTMSDRITHRVEIEQRLRARLATRSAQEWYTAITAAGVPCGPINSVAEGVALAEELGLDPVVRAPDAAAVPTVRNPVDYSATPPSYRRSPPPAGADSAEVRDWLDR